MDKESLIILFLGTIAMLLLVNNMYSISDFCNNLRYSKDLSYGEISIAENCKGLDLHDTCACLNVNIRQIYKYNYSETDKTFNELMKEGGDCRDWSLLYYRLGKQLGFNSKIIYVDMDNQNKHAFCTLSNKNGYCLLDQKGFVYARVEYE